MTELDYMGRPHDVAGRLCCYDPQHPFLFVWRKAIALEEMMNPDRYSFGKCSPSSLPYSRSRRHSIGFFVGLMKAGLYSVVQNPILVGRRSTSNGGLKWPVSMNDWRRNSCKEGTHYIRAYHLPLGMRRSICSSELRAIARFAILQRHLDRLRHLLLLAGEVYHR